MGIDDLFAFEVQGVGLWNPFHPLHRSVAMVWNALNAWWAEIAQSVRGRMNTVLSYGAV